MYSSTNAEQVRCNIDDDEDLMNTPTQCENHQKSTS